MSSTQKPRPLVQSLPHKHSVPPDVYKTIPEKQIQRLAMNWAVQGSTLSRIKAIRTRFWDLHSLIFSWHRRSLLALKRPRRHVDPSHPSSAEVKNVWSHTSTPGACLHGVNRIDSTLSNARILKSFWAKTPPVEPQYSVIVSLEVTCRLICYVTHFTQSASDEDTL